MRMVLGEQSFLLGFRSLQGKVSSENNLCFHCFHQREQNFYLKMGKNYVSYCHPSFAVETDNRSRGIAEQERLEIDYDIM